MLSGVRPRLIAGYVAIVLLLGVACFAAVYSGAQVRSRYTHTVKIDDALIDNVTTRTKLVDDEETGVRGFLLTDRARFLEPYLSARRALPALRTGGDRLASQADPDVIPALRSMTDRSHVWERWAAATLKAGAAENPRSPHFVALMDVGKQLFDRYRQASGAVLARLHADRQRDLSTSDRTLAEVNLLMLVVFGVALLVLAVVGALTTRMVTAPLDQLRRAAERIGEGDLDQPVSVDGTREFLVVGRSMEQMRAARKQAEAAVEKVRHQYESILNSAGEGMYMVDEAGRVTYINPAATQMLGWSAAELSGRRIHDLTHHTRPDGSPYPARECAIYDVVRHHSTCRISDEVFWRKDGTSFPVEYVATPILEGNQAIGAVCMFRDVTERREVERMKDEFISVVSHELRTPLTSIRGSLGLLAGGVLGELPAEAQHMLDIAATNTDRLVRLINDILDIERIQSGRVEMKPEALDASKLVSQALDTMRPMAEKAGVRLLGECTNGALFADPDRMTQVLTNLLSNAIKFSEEGKTVRLSCYRDADALMFQVDDEGRGIPADKLDTIFERFQQVDASDSREKGGTGLGLAIVRTIVEGHGGRIWVESQEGVGSSFFVALPPAPEAAGIEPASNGSSLPESVGPLILLCDDDPAVRSEVSSVLINRGYRVCTVGSGAAAVAEALAQRPDAVLLDLLMPGMNGWQTLAALKEHESTASIPVVIFSVLTPATSGEKGEEIAGWLSKPLDEPSLFTALEDAIRQSRVARVLVVEDDLDLAAVLMTMFQRHGAETHHAPTGAEAIQLSQRVEPDMIVLDLVLPDCDGYSVVDWLRRYDRLHSTPLVVYSALDLADIEQERLRLGETMFFTKSRVSQGEFEQRVVGLLDGIVSASANGKGRDEAHTHR